MGDKTKGNNKESKNKKADDAIECPTCGNKISAPKSLKCPRCFSSIVKLGCGGNCSGCADKC
ncbi:hypothetical protein [Phosphitispora fastidiosa]|uniref:hypothetical protein n=1 Tax=Phosphitispora fastidiosa TaxID=2837202 RepID=UPI001E4357C8|nr:hypothetical protein [Phosphitispora fastidiosa]MBU7005126.1 DNA-directed RNA polymerase subunit RPC12/RpoP [Phosphitispora fastidiosa]